MHFSENKKKYIFPGVITLFFLIFVSLGINGSSVGMYHDLLHEPDDHDSSLLHGTPKNIRSDEWAVWTPMTVIQDINDYPNVNENVTGGTNFTLHFEIPSFDWSTIFKFQDWSYFLLPFENAFALKWWLGLYLLLLASYFYSLKLFPKKYLFATLVSIFFSFSPFIFWWYQSSVLLTLAIALFIILWLENLLEHIDHKKTLSYYLINSLFVFYLLTSYFFLLYPPFQISVAVVLAFYLAGRLLQYQVNKKPDKLMWKKLLVLGIIPILLLGSLAIVFVNQNQSAINRMNNSSYPGSRVITPGLDGGIKYNIVFDSHFMPFNQGSLRGNSYYHNQSEQSNFIHFLPLLTLFGAILAVRSWRHKKTNYLMLSLTVCSVFLLSFILVPVEIPIYDLLLLNKVPHNRLIIGIGFLNFLLLVAVIKHLSEKVLERKYLMFCYMAFLMYGLGLLYFTIKTNEQYPDMTGGILLPLLFLLLILGSAFALLKNRTVSLLLLVILTLGSIFKVMPLYQGLGELRNGRLVSHIRDNYPKESTWMSNINNSRFSHFPSLAGTESLSGIYLQPKPDMWTDVFGEQHKDTVNRKAHYYFTEEQKEPLVLLGNNKISVRFDCGLLKSTKVDYVLANLESKLPCLKLESTVKYPKKVFYIYSFDR